MQTNGHSGVSNSSLSANPFAILGVSLASTRAEINLAAEEKSFTLDESTSNNARTTLITPASRLKAEIAWLPGMDAQTINQLLSDIGVATQVTTETRFSALGRTNALAALLEKWLDQNADRKWLLSEFAKFIDLEESIIALEVESELNKYRVESGFPQISRGDLVQALADQRLYYFQICRRILHSMSTNEQTGVLNSLLESTTEGSDILRSLVVEYGHYIESELESLSISNMPNHVDLPKRLTAYGAELQEITRRIESFGQKVQPILKSHVLFGGDHSTSIRFFREVRGLAVELANDREEYAIALQITRLLQEWFGELDGVKQVLDRDIETLVELQNAKNQYFLAVREGRLPQPGSNNSLPRNRWPEEDRPYPAGVHTTSSASVWDRIPNSLKVIAALLLVGWVANLFTEGDATTESPTRPTSTVSSCDGIRDWWSSTDDRWDRMMTIFDPNETISQQGQTEMSKLISSQRNSNPPAAAQQFNRAVINYYQFFLDTVNDNSMSASAWNSRNDRLFRRVQTTQQAAAKSCDIELIDSAPDSLILSNGSESVYMWEHGAMYRA